MTSQKPGKTLLINHFIINNNWFLVDLPDMGLLNGEKKEDRISSGLSKIISWNVSS